jgi:hypothetical protein
MKRKFYAISNPSAEWADVYPPNVDGSFETFEGAVASGARLILNAETGQQYEHHLGDKWTLIDTAEHTPA